MTVKELKTNDLDKIVGGVEPPKYESPEAEARAKELAKRAMALIHSHLYTESSPGSGLYKMRCVRDGK